MTFFMNLVNLNASVDGYYNSTIGVIDIEAIEVVIYSVEEIIKDVLNILLKKGTSISYMLHDLFGIHFISFSALNISSEEQYM